MLQSYDFLPNPSKVFPFKFSLSLRNNRTIDFLITICTFVRLWRSNGKYMRRTPTDKLAKVD